uniref:Uncharacterized protein n=1 Tax=Molossus molossus TaxID=27622 RepID=A0A7J8FS26_MOLMO|nr:hypothetical protein HJG59_008344 [Molossus molossus]
MKSFEAKSRLWKVQCKRNNTVHFPTLEGQKLSMTLEYAGECAKLIEGFNERFKDMKSKQMELNIFATPFNVEPAYVPDNLQHEMLQSDNELKASYILPPLEFYKSYISNDEFPTLRKHALNMYLCLEQLTTANTSFKNLRSQSRLRSRLADANLEKQS